jgi:TetR/AcrR family transcriptional repressor of mexJK operon
MKRARKTRTTDDSSVRPKQLAVSIRSGEATFSRLGVSLGPHSFSKYRAILKAATHVFTTQGFAQASMDVIAERAQVSKRTVYHHFETKQELFAAVVQTLCANVVPPSLESLQIETSRPEQVLREIGIQFLQGIYDAEQIELFRTIATEARTFPELGALMFDGPVTRSEQLVAQYLQHLASSDLLRVTSPVLAAGQFLGMIKTNLQVRLLLKPQTRVSTNEIKTVVESSVDLFLYGALRPQRSSRSK